MNKFKKITMTIIFVATLFAGIKFLSPNQTTVFADNTSLVLEYDGKSVTYNSKAITLVLNNETINNNDLNIPPVIINDRVLVPARDIFERLGANIDWDFTNGIMTLEYESYSLIIKNDNQTILLNDVEQFPDVYPKNINGRIMLPINFVSTSLGLVVEWFSDTKSVTVNKAYNNQDGYIVVKEKVIELEQIIPEYVPPAPIVENNGPQSVTNSIIQKIDYPFTKVTNFVLPTSESPCVFAITANSEITDVKSFSLTDNRLIVDVLNSDKSFDDKTFEYNSPFISSIRSATNIENGLTFTRFVFDLLYPQTCNLSLSDDRKTVFIAFECSIISHIDYIVNPFEDVIAFYSSIPLKITGEMVNNQLVLNMPFVKFYEETNQFVNGSFTSGYSTLNSFSKGIITFDLLKNVDFEVLSIGNVTYLKLRNPTYKNISYSENTIKIAKETSSFDLNNFTLTDNYNKLNYQISLNGNYENLLGYGTYNINSDFIKNVSIETINDNTILVINEKQIFVYDIYQDNDFIYIRPINPKEKYSKILVLDAGHGGKFVGTNGFGVTEKNINLEVSQKVMALLESNSDIKIYATRLNDSVHSNDNAVDLKYRADMASAIGDLFVSIHYNAERSHINGTETFYLSTNNNTTNGFSSKQLSQNLQKHMLSALGLHDRRVKTSNFVVLKNTIPSSLIEIGFLSNQRDNQIITSEDGKNRAAYAIYHAILESFSSFSTIR